MKTSPLFVYPPLKPNPAKTVITDYIITYLGLPTTTANAFCAKRTWFYIDGNCVSISDFNFKVLFKLDMDEPTFFEQLDAVLEKIK